MLTEYSRRLELEHLIESISQMAIFPPYLLNFPNEIFVFLKYKETGKFLEPWLKRLILFESVPLVNTEEDYDFLRPTAEFIRSLLDLCLSLQIRDIADFSDPYLIWFLAVTNTLQSKLDSSLLADSPQNFLKKSNVKFDRQLIKDFEELSVSGEGDMTYQKLILLKAQKIARIDDNYYKHHWKPFLRAWRRYLWELERCKYLQVFQITLDGGVFFSWSGRNSCSGILPEEIVVKECNRIVTKLLSGGAK